MSKGKIKDPALGLMLRELRKEKGLKSPQTFAEKLGGKYSVAGILRRESGALKIDLDYVEDFCEALELTKEESEKVLISLRVGLWKAQDEKEKIIKEYFNLYGKSKKQLVYFASCIPGHLQTLGYATAIVKSVGILDNPEKIAMERLSWGKSVLEDESRILRVVCSEAALYLPYGDESIMLEQLTFLHDFEDVPSFEFRILPSNVFLPTPLHEDMTILDDSYCVCETRLGVMTSEDGDVADRMRDSFETIWSRSVIGLRRNKLIERAIEYYKTGER